MTSIRQSMIDGQFETRIDGATIRHPDRETVETIAVELAMQRAMKARVEESMDTVEQMRAEDQEGLTIEPWAIFAFIVLMVGVFSVLAYFGW